MESNNIGGIFGGIAELQHKVGGTILSLFIGKPAWNENIRFLRASIFNIALLLVGILLAYFLENGWIVFPFAIFGFGTSIIVSIFKETNNTKKLGIKQNAINFEYDFTINNDLFTEPRSGIKIKVYDIQKDFIKASISNDSNGYRYSENNSKKYNLNEKFIINASSSYSKNVAYEILIKDINFDIGSVKIIINEILF